MIGFRPIIQLQHRNDKQASVFSSRLVLSTLTDVNVRPRKFSDRRRRPHPRGTSLLSSHACVSWDLTKPSVYGHLLRGSQLIDSPRGRSDNEQSYYGLLYEYELRVIWRFLVAHYISMYMIASAAHFVQYIKHCMKDMINSDPPFPLNCNADHPEYRCGAC